MRDQMHVRTLLPGKVGRKRVIGGVHAPDRHEVARGEQPGLHARAWARIDTRPCNAPARNQNCKPICVTNGVNVKINAAVPRLAASTTAADARIRASGLLRAICASLASVTTRAPTDRIR